MCFHISLISHQTDNVIFPFSCEAYPNIEGSSFKDVFND